MNDGGASSNSCCSGPSSYGPYARLVQRLLIWGAVFLVLFILRSFFLLIFLTFVFSYIQSNGVNRLNLRVKNRTVCVVLVFIVFLGVIVALGNFLLPRVRAQAESFADSYPRYLRTLDSSLLGAATKYPALERLFPQLAQYREANEAGERWTLDKSPSVRMMQDLGGPEGEGERRGHSQVVDQLRDVFGRVMASISAFLLSLLFSFLIVLDLPRLAASACRLRDSKLRFAYDEVIPTLTSFGRVLGRALEAQMFIALLNTILTAIGIYMLGLRENVAFISVIVFLCSFIPVAGVFISSLPIFLLALQIGGFVLMLLSAVLITVIHMIEAYILNPRIYGHHLRMNPVIVLIILTIGGKLFGVWGLILGVPICTYLFTDAIREKEEGLPHEAHA